MRTETKWAVIATILLLVVFFIGKMLGFQTEENYGGFQILNAVTALLIFVVIYYMVCREKREIDLGGTMTWEQGFWAAGTMTLIYIPLSMAVIYAFVKWISPDFAAFAAQLGGGADYGKTTMNFWLSSHVWAAILGGLFFSILIPFFTRKSVA